MTDDHTSGEDYEDIVRKMSAVEKGRSVRESEVEEALSEPMPRLLNRVLGEHGGSVRPALRDLNSRLDDAGQETNVSSATFYNWREKYRLDDRDYSTFGNS